MRKITPYNILKGIRYLKHFGLKEFMVRLRERLEPEEVPYEPWYESYRLSEDEFEREKKEARQLMKRLKRERGEALLFSVVVPAFRTPVRYLEEMIDSVSEQSWTDWELCIVNASPEDEKMRAVLRERAALDPRIRVIALEDNLGIAGNTNEGLKAAKGAFIVLLDHDDRLSPSALYQTAAYLGRHPEAAFVYTDEDKISEDGKRHFQPHLKPDYNPDLLRSNNYICHMAVIRRDIVTACRGLDTGFDGAQDHDFFFRCIRRAKAEGLMIGHVPEILYHWRVSAGSTADNPASKMYAYEAGKRAIERELECEHCPGEVRLKKDLGFYRVVYPVRGEPLVSVLIPNKDHRETLQRCISSILERTTYSNYEIIVIENNSEDPETFAYYKEIASMKVRVVTWEGKGFNYSALNNFGFSHARGSYIICLNNDTQIISSDWMEELLGTCQRPEVGIVGAKLYYPDNRIQHAGIVIGIGGIAASMFTDMPRERSGYLHKASLMQDLSAVTAACMIVRSEVWRQLGGFEEKLSVAFNDVDFCLRSAQAGYLTVYNPYVELYHHESKSRGREDSREKVRRFQGEIEFFRTRWEQLLKDGDPYYNKNLSLSKWNYTLKQGARMGRR